MTPPAIPPSESLDDVRAMLREHHPELTDEQIDAILHGPPAKRRPSSDGRNGWYANKGRKTAKLGIRTKVRQRGGWRGRKGIR